MRGIGIGIGKRHPVIVAAGGGGPAEIVVNAVHFDGTNDWLTRGAALTGAVDGPALLQSIWFGITGGDGLEMNLMKAGNDRLITRRLIDGRPDFDARNAAAAQLLRRVIDADYDTITNPGWNHVLFAANFVATPVANIFINDVEVAFTDVIAPTTGDIDWTVPDWGFGANPAGLGKWVGDVAEAYITDEYLDITVEANRRKFISAGGKPVDMGADASDPTGTAPLIFFSGATASWHTNKGSGGGFTENGALTDAATSPSD